MSNPLDLLFQAAAALPAPVPGDTHVQVQIDLMAGTPDALIVIPPAPHRPSE
jgi:hypothetical protein